MDRAGLEIDTKSPFGTYPLDFRQQIACKLARKSRSKRVINILRSIGGLRSCKIADVEIYGSQMRLYPQSNRSDKIMLARPHMFDAAERQALAKHLREAGNPSFIDIGANIGAYSIFVQSLELATKIIAIEADREVFKRLQYNLPNAIKLNIAVAAEEGVVPFYINEASRGENSLVEGEGMRRIDVPAKRLLQILDDNNILTASAVKIDIEGAELSVLQKFFSEAPTNRWPEMFILEHLHSRQAMELLLQHNYSEIVKTKMNVVLKR